MSSSFTPLVPFHTLLLVLSLCPKHFTISFKRFLPFAFSKFSSKVDLINSYSYINLIVVPPTWIRKPPKDIEVISGNSLAIPCLATGSPKPRVIWKREIGKLNAFKYHFRKSKIYINQKSLYALNEINCKFL